MKSGLDIFVTVILVAGGILAYHMLVVAPAHRPEQEQDLAVDAGTEYEVGDPIPAATPGDSGDMPALEGGDEKQARANLVRIAKLERTLARVLRTLQPGALDGDTRNPLPPFSQFELVNPNSPVFDAGTLDTLTAYLDEIERRKRDAKQRVRIGQNLVAQGLSLSEQQRKDVADLTVRVQHLVDDLSRRVSSGEVRPNDRSATLKDLQDEYTSALGRIVPAADVAKILKSRVVRRLGFPSPKGDGRGDPRNRND